MNFEEAKKRILKEFVRATRLHDPIKSVHEGIAVIREEYLELEREVFKKHPDIDLMKMEAAELGAMALRFLTDMKDT